MLTLPSLRSSALRSVARMPQTFPGFCRRGRATSSASPVPFPQLSGTSLSDITLRQRLFGSPRSCARTILLISITGAGGLYYVAHLERVEESGRWRFMDMSIEAEKRFGQQMDENVMHTHGAKILPQNHPISIRVAKVASRIITAANLGSVKGVLPSPSLGSPVTGSVGASAVDWEWEVYVIKEDQTANAFVTAGGKIFVFTGMLPIAGNEDGLATVLGHEIAHRVERHAAEKVSFFGAFVALMILLDVIGLGIGTKAGVVLLMMLPNRRRAESEADTIGLRLMAQACYDPNESVHFWKRMSDLENMQEGQNWLSWGGDFFSTHPASEKRIKTLQDCMPRALEIHAQASHALEDRYSWFRWFRGFGLNL
ncbi:hypothetical protein FRB94_008223 [Tulasnella sp. JGI-2019a]|nr:hypothetical protein FRB93_005517 [Tulasnella sp. JGI-2019a]KAG8996523.1 hypothetical protein FRB94_008223 [Tulasnella sp. JGI-2019a]KAG9031969.1 hypothetical protein FRB95_002050 [Tulasnella sp. JGI-2019a]